MAIVHNVQIHPVYAGHVNDHKVMSEREFDNFDEAKNFMEQYNEFHWKSAASWPFAIDTETGDNLLTVDTLVK